MNESPFLWYPLPWRWLRAGSIVTVIQGEWRRPHWLRSTGAKLQMGTWTSGKRLSSQSCWDFPLLLKHFACPLLCHLPRLSHSSPSIVPLSCLPWPIPTALHSCSGLQGLSSLQLAFSHKSSLGHSLPCHTYFRKRNWAFGIILPH